MSEEAFEGYERQYCELSSNLARKCTVAASVIDEEQKSKEISELQSGLDEADVLIRNMERVAKSLQPVGKAVLAKLREYRYDLIKLVRIVKSAISSLTAHEELLESGMANIHLDYKIEADLEKEPRKICQTPSKLDDDIKVVDRLLLEYEATSHGPDKWQKLTSFICQSLEGQSLDLVKKQIDHIVSEKSSTEARLAAAREQTMSAQEETREWKQRYDVAVREAKSALEKAAAVQDWSNKQTQQREDVLRAEFAVTLADKEAELGAIASKLESTELSVTTLSLQLKGSGGIREKGYEEKEEPSVFRYEFKCRNCQYINTFARSMRKCEPAYNQIQTLRFNWDGASVEGEYSPPPDYKDYIPVLPQSTTNDLPSYKLPKVASPADSVSERFHLSFAPFLIGPFGCNIAHIRNSSKATVRITADQCDIDSEEMLVTIEGTALQVQAAQAFIKKYATTFQRQVNSPSRAVRVLKY